MSAIAGASAPGQYLRADVVDNLKCPITRELMTNPVIAADGHTYERAAIEQWFRRSGVVKSPVTLERLANKGLIANHAVKSLISEHFARELAEARGEVFQGADSPRHTPAAAASNFPAGIPHPQSPVYHGATSIPASWHPHLPIAPLNVPDPPPVAAIWQPPAAPYVPPLVGHNYGPLDSGRVFECLTPGEPTEWSMSADGQHVAIVANNTLFVFDGFRPCEGQANKVYEYAQPPHHRGAYQSPTTLQWAPALSGRPSRLAIATAVTGVTCVHLVDVASPLRTRTQNFNSKYKLDLKWTAPGLQIDQAGLNLSPVGYMDFT